MTVAFQTCATKPIVRCNIIFKIGLNVDLPNSLKIKFEKQ